MAKKKNTHTLKSMGFLDKLLAVVLPSKLTFDLNTLQELLWENAKLKNDNKLLKVEIEKQKIKIG